MKLGLLPVAQAEGAVLVHTTRAGDAVLKKGRVLSPTDLATLAAGGVEEVTCAVLEPDDVAEDQAAAALASAVAGPGTTLEDAKTGRCNLRAAHAGLLVVGAERIHRINVVDERLTLATLPDATAVRAGDLVATVKIIPFGVPRAALGAAIAAADTVRAPDTNVRISDHIPHASSAGVRAPDVVSDDAAVRPPDIMRGGDVVRDPDSSGAVRDPDDLGPLQVRPWLGKRAGLVLTRFADTHPSLLERAAAAQRERLARCGGQIASEQIVAHRVDEVAAAIQRQAAAGLDPILVLGASAIMDRRDVIPTAVEAAGGEVLRFGMPVDPGNLLMIGRLDRGNVVLGVPGCARSLKRSGFDWALERCCAGLEISSAQVAALGVGGLLDEIELRPAPRAEAGDDPDLATRRQLVAVVLAAGMSSRMGSAKLLEELDGKPLIRWACEAALASRAHPVVVVTGHRGDEVAAALAGLAVELAPNPAYAEGLASSLRAGLARAEELAPQAEGVLVCLGDMPKVTSEHLDRLMSAFDPEAAPIVVPTCQRKRGNPVLWGRRYFSELGALRGDVGARSLLERHAERICFVALDDPAILLDVDTPQALRALRHPNAPPTDEPPE